MTILKEGGINPREDDLLTRNNHSLAILTRKHDAPRWHYFQRAVLFTTQVEAAFILSVLAFVVPSQPVGVCLGLAALLLLLFHFMPVVVLARTYMVGKFHKPIYRRAFFYWSWWRVHTFSACFFAALVGFILGYYFYATGFWPYRELAKLKYYQDVNPAVVPGQQVQDAGLVHFGMAASLDRSKGGCFKNDGHTYCVAPIVEFGEVHSGFGGSPRFGSYDYFAVGIDCCNCPNQDFRCGEWDNPIAQGGIRSLDSDSRPFYRLAVDSWTATYRKTSEHPLFFEWVQDPKFYWRDLWNYPVHMGVWAVAALVPLAFFWSMFLGKILHIAVDWDMATSQDVPRPPQGLEAAWAKWLPDMLDRYHEEQQQILGLPVQSPPRYHSMANCEKPAAQVQIHHAGVFEHMLHLGEHRHGSSHAPPAEPLGRPAPAEPVARPPPAEPIVM